MTWDPALHTAAMVVFDVLLGLLVLKFLYYLMLIGFALPALPLAPPHRRTRALWRRHAHRAPSVALIAPAYDEELSIIESVTSLLGQDYPAFEVIVVNDGSRDATLARLVEHFGLIPAKRCHNLWIEHAPIRELYTAPAEPRLLVVDKDNGGSKADAVNAGINVARASLVSVVDSDSLLEPDALQGMVRPFIRDPQRTVAVGGSVRVVNGCTVEGGRLTAVRLPRSLLAKFQVVEYLRAFLLGRVAMSRLGTLTIVSGAFGLFERRVLLEVGGFERDSCGEDFELIIAMHRHMREQRIPYRIVFVADPVCWTEVPEDLSGLGSQRARWQRGAVETFVRHRKMALNPAYGRIGMFAFARMVAIDFIGPFLAAAGYVLVPLLWALGLLGLEYALAFAAFGLSFGMFVSVATLVVEEVELRRFPRARDLAVLMLVAFAENVGYRQLNNLWRLRGIWDYLRGNTEWVEIKRVGLGG